MGKIKNNYHSAFRIPHSAFHNPVLFVGAGPGDPELITVKGRNALREADLVIYTGSLVPKGLLKWTKPETKILNSASMHLEEIINEIENAFAEGKHVVRFIPGIPVYTVLFLNRWRSFKSDQSPIK